MKSPITGKEMKLCYEKVSQVFRKEEFHIMHQYYLCEKSGERFESEALMEVNLNQVYNQYRAKYNLPFPEEIKEIREKHRLPANKMAEILGFGINVYRGYENGEVPSESNARLMQLAKDPLEFKKLLLLSNIYDKEELKEQLNNIDVLLKQEHDTTINDNFVHYAFGLVKADIYTGFRLPNLEKFNQMVVYYSEHTKPWKTKLNKLLFYSDFLHFKTTGYSISGSRYQAYQMGPVPKNFNTLYEYAANNNYVEVNMTEFQNGGIGEQFHSSGTKFNRSLFSTTELIALEKVLARFKKASTTEMIELSHEEEAWNGNKGGPNEISYEYSFSLKHVQ